MAVIAMDTDIMNLIPGAYKSSEEGDDSSSEENSSEEGDNSSSEENSSSSEQNDDGSSEENSSSSEEKDDSSSSSSSRARDLIPMATVVQLPSLSEENSSSSFSSRKEKNSGESDSSESNSLKDEDYDLIPMATVVQLPSSVGESDDIPLPPLSQLPTYDISDEWDEYSIFAQENNPTLDYSFGEEELEFEGSAFLEEKYYFPPTQKPACAKYNCLIKEIYETVVSQFTK